MIKYSQKSLPHKVKQTIIENNLVQPGETIVVALSGGGDSVTLLDILLKLKDELKITVAACHFNHRLRGEESYNDEEFVKNLCGKRGINCITDRAMSDNLYKNEEEARGARYKFFEKILNQSGGARVAIAHNANDLVETFLLRIVRGTGIRGLRSIPLRRKNFIRPLLYISRDEIMSYLADEKLSYCTDKTNKDTSLSRNFVRLKVLPLLLELNPNLIETTSNSIKAYENDYDFIESMSKEAYKRVLEDKSKDKIILNRRKWLLLPSSLRALVLRQAISEGADLTDITQKQIAEVILLLEKGRGGKFKLLPRSLRIELLSGKIIMSFQDK